MLCTVFIFFVFCVGSVQIDNNFAFLNIKPATLLLPVFFYCRFTWNIAKCNRNWTITKFTRIIHNTNQRPCCKSTVRTNDMVIWNSFRIKKKNSISNPKKYQLFHEKYKPFFRGKAIKKLKLNRIYNEDACGRAERYNEHSTFICVACKCSTERWKKEVVNGTIKHGFWFHTRNTN